MRYVGITGFMARAEVDACRAALPEGMTLMCGVLASEKSLAGIRNKWHRRYAAPADIAGIFSDDPRCLNLIHYCSGEPPSEATIQRLWELGCPDVHGFQFNGAWPTAETIRPLSRRHQVVLQLPTRAVADVLEDPRTFNSIACMFTGSRCHLLLDGSGGRGVPLDVRDMREHVKALRLRLGYYFGLGVAGGLCAEAVAGLAPLRGYDVSIDAEGRLRDGDEGGTLNLDKASAYLRAAGEIFGGGR